MSNKTTNAAALPGSDLSMRKIASPHSLVATSLALAISGGIANPLYAEEISLDTLHVEDTGIQADANPYAEEAAPYKARTLSDSRRTRDIADTPQTMTVITHSREIILVIARQLGEILPKVAP